MNMKKEKLKTGILLLLICSAITLAANVWFGSGIWPQGYDYFVTLPSRAFFSQFFGQGQPYISPMENLAKPQKLVVTNGEKRAVYYNSDANFSPFYESVNAFFKEILKNEGAVFMSTEVGEEEWYDVLRNDELLDTRSLYFSYTTAFSPSLFAKVCGVEGTWLEKHISAMQEMILAPIGDTGEDVLLYVRDHSDGKIKKFYINYGGKSDIYTRISSLTENENYSYAFELNLHDSVVGIGGGVAQKVVMDPLILISPRSSQNGIIRGENPVGSVADTEALLSVFGYRERGVNRFTGTDGTMHFVENYGSINLYPDGLVEYYAVDNKKGVNILPAEGGTASLYDALNGAVGFAARVWTSLVPDMPFEALVSSDLVENESGDYTFTLDYYYEGTPITIAARDLSHAVEIRVKEGRIVEYRHLLRRFSETGQVAESVPMIEAMDNMYARFASEETQIRITNLFLSYVEDTAQGAKQPVWCATIEGRDDLVIDTPTA